MEKIGEFANLIVLSHNPSMSMAPDQFTIRYVGGPTVMLEFGEVRLLTDPTFDPFQHAIVQRLSELGIAYRGSPIVEGHGKRYFDDSLRGGMSISSRFLLVLGNEEESLTTEAAKQLAASFTDVVELRLGSGQGNACPARWLHRILCAQPR